MGLQNEGKSVHTAAAVHTAYHVCGNLEQEETVSWVACLSSRLLARSDSSFNCFLLNSRHDQHGWDFITLSLCVYLSFSPFSLWRTPKTRKTKHDVDTSVVRRQFDSLLINSHFRVWVFVLCCLARVPVSPLSQSRTTIGAKMIK